MDDATTKATTFGFTLEETEKLRPKLTSDDAQLKKQAVDHMVCVCVCVRVCVCVSLFHIHESLHKHARTYTPTVFIVLTAGCVFGGEQGTRSVWASPEPVHHHRREGSQAAANRP